MSDLPTVKLHSFPEFILNSQVIFNGEQSVDLQWNRQSENCYFARANGLWIMQISVSGNRRDIKITAELDKTYDHLSFRYFEIPEISADHILPQTSSRACRGRDLRNISRKEDIYGETIVSITKSGCTTQFSTPYQSGFPALFSCAISSGTIENAKITTDVNFYGSNNLEFPELSIRESSDGWQMLEEYAGENSRGKVCREPVCGWNSWDYYRWTITEDEVLKNAETIFKDPVLSKHVKRIIIDDGWQYCYGEWEPNCFFPSGMEKLAAELKKMNFTPGLWFAPCIVEPHARIAQLESDMLGKSEGNQPCLAFECMRRYGFVLDPTNPKAQKFWEELFRRYTGYGYGYFKLDFLRAAINAPRRHDPLSKRDDLVRLILESVRRGTGNRAEILGCNYVFSSGCHCVDTARIGADIHAKWNNAKNNAPVVAARYWQNRKLWINDPDFAVCRAEHTSVDPDLNALQPEYVYVNPDEKFNSSKHFNLSDFKRGEPEVLLSVVIISGGAVNLSDCMYKLNEEGIELCRKTVAAEPGMGGKALDLFTNSIPEQFVQQFKSGIRLLAVNWQDEGDRSFIFDLAACGISPEMKACDFWSGDKVKHDGRKLCITLAPHRCQLLEFRI